MWETRIRVFGGNMETLMPVGGGTYQVAIERAYGSEVLNPSSSQLASFVRGETDVSPGKHKLLFGITLNGVCPADCLGCPYSRTTMGAQYDSESDRRLSVARPVNSAELGQALSQARGMAIRRGILVEGETFAAGALLAGDPGYSPYVADLITTVSRFPGCEACRWSSIAPDTQNNVLAAFITGAIRAKALNPGHVPSFQISLHSTDHKLRIEHTGVTRLLPMADMAVAAAEIYRITGRKLTLAFVVHQGTDIDPEVLLRTFSPDDTMLSLRPIHSPTVPALAADQLVALYSTLRKDGWDVVYMPPNHSSGDNGQPLELDNMRVRGL